MEVQIIRERSEQEKYELMYTVCIQQFKIIFSFVLTFAP